MKKISLLLLLLLVGCSPRIVQQKDTATMTNTVYKEILRDTTIYVEMPRESLSVSTFDTSSVLKTDMAISTASVSRGILTHTLANRSDYKPNVVVKYKDIVQYRDSIVYVQTKDTEYVEKELTLWQKVTMRMGKLCCLFLFVFVIFIFGRYFVRKFT